ncbi:unknown [Clostridium sp. CAG:169]|nr:unknown [Clostridium sp. CAG:169]
MNDLAIGKGHSSAERINIRDRISLILLHFLRYIVKVIANAKHTGLTVNRLVITDFQLDTSHRRFLRRKNNLLKEHIAVCSTEVLHLKSLHLNFLNQTLIKRIQSIQYINCVMLNSVGCGIVQGKQWIKILKCFLCNSSTHFLRFIQNNDRSVCLDNINRTARAKFITLRVNDTGFFTSAIFFQGRSKRLRIDNHYIDAGAGRKIIQLIQVGTVVDEEASLLAVMLHKVISGNFKSLFDTLTNGNRRHNNDEFAPTIFFVQLEHSLDIHIGLTGSGLHFDIKATST